MERNLIRRHMREAFRRHQFLLEPKRATLTLMLVFRSKAKGVPDQIRGDVMRALRLLSSRLAK